MNKRINKVVIVGGGTAGWMAAASLAKLLGKTIKIVLIESEDIPTVGVGEATIPTLVTHHDLLGINEQEFMARVNATFKLGISFENWRDVDEDYIHSFGFTGRDCWAAGFQHFWLKGRKLGIAKDFGEYCSELVAAREEKFAVMPKLGLNYAYHMDAGLYAQFLREIAEKHGAVRQEGKVIEVGLNGESGYIENVKLESGKVIEGDLFIDCSGFQGLLIEKTLHSGYDDWSHWLPCDSAVAMQTESVADPIPYTRSIARDAGWQWRIPLQSRVGNGMVFCSRYKSDDDAIQMLSDNVDGKPLNDPRVIKFRTGMRRKHWNKNCIAMGLSSGFIEPLESTSIHFFQRSITRLMQMFPFDGIRQPDVEEFNLQMNNEMTHTRDFIILHYHVTNRTDTPFWRFCKSMDIPDSLKHRIELFKQTGRVFKNPTELFGENSWTQVMLGQGLMPEQYHPIVNMMSDEELKVFLDTIEDRVAKQLQNMPKHNDFIQHYCRSAAM